MAFNREAVRSAYLNVTANGKTTKMAVSAMTDAQLVAALGRADNAGALADGWTRNANGSITKSAAPAPAPGVGGGPGAGGAPQPAPTSATPQPGVGTVAPGTAAPTTAPGGAVTGYLRVYQKQADGKYKVVLVHKSKLTPAQLASALKSPLNAGGEKSVTPTPGQPAPDVTPDTTPPSPTDPAPPTDTTAPGGGPATGAIASWIPPMVGLGGINADPLTGKIDWSKLLATAKEISAVDPEYAQDISGNIMRTMQSLAPMQSEIQGLTSIDPTSGKTLYQSLFDNAMQKYGQGNSSTFGNAAARGIASSGMVNQTIAGATSANQEQIAGFGRQYGNQRIADLLKQMTGQLATQDNDFSTSYYRALSRATQGIPQVA